MRSTRLQLADDFAQPVPNPLRRARVAQTVCQPVRQAQPTLDLAQHQQSAIRGQPAAVKASDNGPALNR